MFPDSSSQDYYPMSISTRAQLQLFRHDNFVEALKSVNAAGAIVEFWENNAGGCHLEGLRCIHQQIQDGLQGITKSKLRVHIADVSCSLMSCYTS